MGGKSAPEGLASGSVRPIGEDVWLFGNANAVLEV